ncbi:sugar kinase [Micrococcales bacterium 31B]|nr:sugar kinase [Micrococcales bacterium 31B]
MPHAQPATSASLFLGIDIGTGSTKAVLADADGTIVATATRGHAMSLPGPGLAEFDAEAVWWSEICELTRELTTQHPAASILAVTVSGLGPTMLVTDENFSPLRPAILYGIDTRAVELIPEIEAACGGADAIFARAGKHLSSQAAGLKLEWIKRHEPDVFARTRHWFNAHTYIDARLTGEYVLDHHTASQCDPFYDVTTQSWIPEWADPISAHVPLPRLVWPGEVIGRITPAAAAATGLAPGTLVAAGTVDAWAEAFSAGITEPGDLMLMYGSTMFMVQVLDQFAAHPILWTTSGVTPGSLTLAAGMATSGSITTWLRDLLGGDSFETLIADAEAVPPGCDGLLLLPYFQGERTPIFDPLASGAILGLGLRHGRGHLLRATYEGIGLAVRHIVEFLEAAAPVRRIVAVGGGTQSALWTQIVSDITGREQEIPEQAVGAAYGDALWSAIAAGAVPSDTRWARAGRVVTPRPECAALYRERFETYLGAYPALKATMHRLAGEA